MKRSMCLLSGVLCLLLVSCQTAVQDNSYREEVNQEIQIEQTVQDEVTDELPSDEEVELWDDDMPEYVKAYTEFLLYEDIDKGHDFPIRGYYLFDLNSGFLYNSGGILTKL